MRVFVSRPTKIDTFFGKTITPQNGMLIFLAKETHSETKSWKSSRILTNKVTTTTVNPGNRRGFCVWIHFSIFLSFFIIFLYFFDFFHFFIFSSFFHFFFFFLKKFFHFFSFFVHFFTFMFFQCFSFCHFFIFSEEKSFFFSFFLYFFQFIAGVSIRVY